jgi:multidrug efflux pump subunit AcrA (membrane-fusion protein)
MNTRMNSRWIILLIFIVLTLFGAWASLAELDQIARATGQVIASARTQVIQSANDGVIEAVLVKEGEAVKKGQVLARLDRSQAKAALQDSLGKVAALKAALTRLQAEVFNRPLAFPDDVRAYPAFVQNQTELFQRRQRALNAEIDALEESLRLVREELTLSEKLLATGDLGRAEVIRLQKQVADLNGQITNRRNKYFQDAQTDMTRAEEDLATQSQLLAERRAVYERTEIAAPANGLVRNIQTTTPGAKVRPGDVVMELLPTGSALIVEAKLKPADVAYVRKGLPAALKLDAFDYSIYGVLRGEVSYISPDALSEKTAQGEQVYYRVQIRIDEAALAERNHQHPGKPVEIQPGMTATVDIATGRQTVLRYLTTPVTKTLSESLSER